MANAVLDGVDGILLGAETLRGKYPVETIKTVSSICRCEGYWGGGLEVWLTRMGVKNPVETIKTISPPSAAVGI